MNILSLDLDWFNTRISLGRRRKVKPAELSADEDIRRFCYRLADSCVLPTRIAYVVEHQYMYPWCLKRLERSGEDKVDVVNIDEHHDFYDCGYIDRGTSVSCGNFLAWMARDGLLGSYTWVNNAQADSTARAMSKHLRSELDILSRITNGRAEVLNKVKIFKKNQVFRAVSGKSFNGFIIVKSPEYTHNASMIANRVLACMRSLGHRIYQDDGYKNFARRSLTRVANRRFAMSA